MQEKTFFNWSSGKDSALALYKLKSQNIAVDKLVTTVNKHYQRVTMHGLPIDVLKAQATCLDIPLDTIELPEKATMKTYEERLGKKYECLKNQGYTHTAFGDIFLEDLKDYREKLIQPYGFKSLYPLWKIDTRSLLQEFLSLGFKTVIICANTNLVPAHFVGKAIDQTFLESLPKNVDPCGENGEFHTFCFDGPIFKSPVSFKLGEKTFRNYPAPTSGSREVTYCFQDIIL